MWVRLPRFYTLLQERVYAQFTTVNHYTPHAHVFFVSVLENGEVE